jgi:tetratricopeptide (TPR) repeat protein
MADTVAQSWLDLGFVYRRQGEDSLEIEAYLEGLEHVPDQRGRLRLKFALGASYEQSDKIDLAVSAFESVIEVDSMHAEALNYLGYLLADRGQRLDYALELISRAVDLVPDNPAFLDSYGWIYYRLGDFEKAVHHLSDAVKLDSDPVMFDHLGDAYESSGNLKEARKWWQKALELNPEDSTIKTKLHQ